MSASMTSRPACVCNYSGHCIACIADGAMCDRPGCRCGRADGSPCRGPMMPAPSRRAPAMPEPELMDDERAPELHDDCARAIIERDAAPEVDVEAALRASLRPAPKPPALLSPRERAARDERHEERAQLARIRASSESRPARALTLADLDAHERGRFSMRGRV